MPDNRSMRRSTLAAFFRHAVIAALPLAAGCEPGTNCGATWTVDGGADNDGGCFARCAQPPATRSTGFCHESTNSSGGVVTVCQPDCTGRRPAGLARAEIRGSALGAHFARMAHLEAASVPAFRRLRAELRAHGAPRRLLDGCTRAARDEVRHARAAARLARRFGAETPRVVLQSAAPRPLMTIAVENAREGCVRESFGALLLTWQARAAADPGVRELLAGLAEDETRHAELAWAVDAWLRTRLPASERARLRQVRRDELAQLAVQVDAAVDAELRDRAGLPPPPVARALHRAFAKVAGAANGRTWSQLV